MFQDSIIEGNFVEDGYAVIRKAINPALSAKLLASVHNSLSMNFEDDLKKLEMETGVERFFEGIARSNQAHSSYDVLKPVWKDLVYAGLLQDIFLEQAIYSYITNILGKDLCFQDDPQLTVNLPGISDLKENYLFKRLHQEVWSGADIHTIQFWTPIFQRDKQGQMYFVKGSHAWGHIPHQNRQPLHMPPHYEQIQSDLDTGDVVIFHSLLLHASVSIPAGGKPRIGLPCLIKNFRYPNHSFECYRNWKIFSYSDLSLIDRKLGNHSLSPFRLIDLPNQRFTDNITY